MKDCPICCDEEEVVPWEDTIRQQICHDCFLRICRHADDVKKLIYSDWPKDDMD